MSNVSEMRLWLTENAARLGLKVPGSRGRFSKEMIEAYNAAHADQTAYKAGDIVAARKAEAASAEPEEFDFFEAASVTLAGDMVHIHLSEAGFDRNIDYTAEARWFGDVLWIGVHNIATRKGWTHPGLSLYENLS